MKVFIAGATGVLGRRLVESLADRSHEVHGLVRDDAGEQVVESLGGTARRGDVLEPDTLNRAIDDDIEVLVHAATAIPDSTKPSDEEWEYNDRVRLQGMKHLLATAPDDIQQVLFPSVVWVARQSDGSQFDETATRHPDRATRSAADVEDFLQTRADRDGFDAAILRCGFFYAPDARDTREWGRDLLSGDLPIVGGGLLGRSDALMSFVHVDDAASAFAAAIERGARGVYHVVDDRPVPGAEFFETFADLLGAPEPSRIPGWLARFFAGKIAADLLTNDWPTTNDKAKRELDWEPTYPTCGVGLQQVVETWRAEGLLVETDTGLEWATEAVSDTDGMATT
jgi:nucleoside-diphosphate-sugar epimerase